MDSLEPIICFLAGKVAFTRKTRICIDPDIHSNQGSALLAFEPASGTCRSPPFFWRQADAVGGHPTQTIICAVYPRLHGAPLPICVRAIKTIREEDANETSHRRRLRNLSRITFTIGFAITLAAPTASDAAEIKVLTNRAMNHVLTELAGAFQRTRAFPD
jgi:hypothetical protein